MTAGSATAGPARAARAADRRSDVAAATAIDLIRRPRAGDPTGRARVPGALLPPGELRILLSDTAADIIGLPTVTGAAGAISAPGRRRRRANQADGDALGRPAGAGPPRPDPTVGTRALGLHPDREAGRNGAVGPSHDGDPEPRRTQAATSQQRHVERRAAATAADDEPSPNAIIRLQRVREIGQRGERPALRPPAPAGVVSTVATDTGRNVLYDPREGVRDSSRKRQTLSRRPHALRRARRPQSAELADGRTPAAAPTR